MHWFWSIWPENLFGLRGVYCSPQPRHQVGSCGSCPPLTKLLGPQQPDRDLPRTNGVGVALAYGVYATVYRSECPQGPECPPPRESGLVTGPFIHHAHGQVRDLKYILSLRAVKKPLNDWLCNSNLNRNLHVFSDFQCVFSVFHDWLCITQNWIEIYTFFLIRLGH